MVPWVPHPGQEGLCTSLWILRLRIRCDSKELYDGSLRERERKKDQSFSSVLLEASVKFIYRIHGQ